MYLWRKSASPKWWRENETRVRALAGSSLATIELPKRKRLQIEAAAESNGKLDKLAKLFGGRIEKLPRNWLKLFLRRKTRPITIGNKRLIIPAGAAFGTGEHATTAMSLRLLEKLSRNRSPGWSAVDLGTGTGILALAAKRLGATRAIGIDNDPIAISTAKANQRRNKIRGVQFRLSDVRRVKLQPKIDIVTSNLFTELLIEILPKLKAARWLILSGVLREQERDVRRALTRNKIDLIEVRPRGKWVAILGASR